MIGDDIAKQYPPDKHGNERAEAHLISFTPDRHVDVLQVRARSRLHQNDSVMVQSARNIAHCQLKDIFQARAYHVLEHGSEDHDQSADLSARARANAKQSLLSDHGVCPAMLLIDGGQVHSYSIGSSVAAVLVYNSLRNTIKMHQLNSAHTTSNPSEAQAYEEKGGIIEQGLIHRTVRSSMPGEAKTGATHLTRALGLNFFNHLSRTGDYKHFNIQQDTSVAQQIWSGISRGLKQQPDTADLRLTPHERAYAIVGNEGAFQDKTLEETAQRLERYLSVYLKDPDALLPDGMDIGKALTDIALDHSSGVNTSIALSQINSDHRTPHIIGVFAAVSAKDQDNKVAAIPGNALRRSIEKEIQTLDQAPPQDDAPMLFPGAMPWGD